MLPRTSLPRAAVAPRVLAPSGREALGVGSPRHGEVTLGPENYCPGQEVTVRVRKKSPEYAEMGPEERKALPFTTQQGRLIGHSTNGEAVVEIPGRKSPVHADFFDVTPTGKGVSVAPQLRTAGDTKRFLLQGISPSSIVSPPPRLLRALDAALRKPVDGTQGAIGPFGKSEAGVPANEYVRAIQDEGYDVLVIGGAIRDVLKALQTPGVTDAELLEKFADLDLVTNAPPKEVRRIAEKLGEGLKNGGLWTEAAATDRYGIVGVGAHKTGLDIAPIKSSFSVFPRSVLGFRLMDDAIARDFSANELYVDLATRKLIDPSGQGIDDALHSRLTTHAKALEQNDSMAFRYLKFRARGFTAGIETQADLRKHIQRFWPQLAKQTDGRRMIGNVVRILPADLRNSYEVEQHLLKLKAVAEDDGLGNFFRSYVTPFTKQISDRYFELKSLRE